jgi:hypothetical protein
MAQADYIIANGTGAAVRSDLNGQLAAIVSNNSGATEPATMYAYQWWADTTAGLLKLRNSANNAWITLRELDGTLLMEDGTAAAPGLSFASDPDSGIFRGGANELGIATNGVERVEFGTSEVVFNDGGANYDFRIEGDTNANLFFVDASAEAVGIGTSAPSAKLSVSLGGVAGTIAQLTDGIQQSLNIASDAGSGSAGVVSYDTANGASQAFKIGTFEKVKIDGSGRLLVGTATAQGQSIFQAVGNSSAPTDPGDIRVIRGLNVSSIGTNVDADLGIIKFGALEDSVCAQISAVCDANWSASDTPGRLVFATTADGASSPTERMRISQNGSVLIGKTSNPGDLATTGTDFGPGYGIFTRDGSTPLYANRKVDDGNLVEFYQASTIEGTISVSGTTVSYNGAHLSRWSQLPSGAERTEILRGSVLSNIDEMCEWDEEDNEQLNRMKVSDVEGDKNVSGVFQAWDDDDDTYTDDFYCAMTGDFIIRIAESVTVERGDLLMSAGDGTAKPQDDDIIRSKTIAKVTSTNVSCTYEDGSYCVPCVLMAC